MATARKKTKKAPSKRFITKKEYDSIIESYFRLKNKVYKLSESDKLNDTAKRELKAFVRALEKARAGVNWSVASNYAAR